MKGSNCGEGYIGKTKDNTLGHKFSMEYLCKNCGLDSKKGELVAREYGNDVMPTEYNQLMKATRRDEEYQAWSKIWWD